MQAAFEPRALRVTSAARNLESEGNNVLVAACNPANCKGIPSQAPPGTRTTGTSAAIPNFRERIWAMAAS
jgi:hypothetical protein